MAKIDLIEQIIRIDNSYTKEELQKKTNKELDKILDEIHPMQEKNKLSESSDIKIDDLEKIKSEMYKEVMEQVKQDIKNESVTEVNTEDQKYESNSDSYAIPAPKRKRKQQIDKSMLVPVMNVTNGKLIYQSKKTGFEFQFEKYGDIEYIEVYELLTMRSSQRRFLDEPYIVILDDEVSEYLGLSRLYNKLTHATEVDKIFKLSVEKMQEVVESAPKGLAHLIVSRAKEKIKNGTLDSVQRIELLENVYNIELSV